MVQVTGVAQRDAWRAGVLPPVESVAAGVWSVPVPIPDNPLRYVLVYLFALPDGLAMVDAGWPTPPAWDALVTGVAKTGHAITDVRAVLVTHAHADHHGLSGRVRAESGAWIGMHAREADTIQFRPDPEKVVENARAWLLERGGSPADAVSLSGTPADLAPFLELPYPDRLIADGERPLGRGHPLRAVWTPGHTPGHLCFHHETAGLFLSGDHVLPRISPNITKHPNQDGDPLAQFLESLERTGSLTVTEVLPAHEYRFAGLRERTDALRAHHAARLDEVLRAVDQRPGATTWELAQRLTWSRPWSQLRGFVRRSAVGETYAHVAHLAATGRLRRQPGDVDRWTRPL